MALQVLTLNEPEGRQIRRIRRYKPRGQHQPSGANPSHFQNPPQTHHQPPPGQNMANMKPPKVPQGNRPHPDMQEDNLKRQIALGAKNDYSQAFVDTGLRPQNFIIEEEKANGFDK